MIYLQIDEDLELPLPEGLLQKAAQETLAHEAVLEEVDLTIVISDDDTLQQLNLEFMGIDAPTDVLSFPADLVDPDTERKYLGDVIISLPRAQSQAPENGQSVPDEVLLLAVHGVLHLLGHDHAEPEEKDRMWAAQAAVLARLPKA
jgi:probable rRNA maturation factor